MRYKIGVFGSAEGDFTEILTKAHLLGEALGKKKFIVITGASTGLPYTVASAAHKNGAEIWGYSQAIDLETQKKLVDHDPSIYKKLIFVPKEYKFAFSKEVCRKYRNVTSTANCDAGIIISGRWGTMNEFTNLFDMGKVIAVLTGTGGVADELPELCKKISKKSNAKVLFSSSPTELVDNIVTELKNRTESGA